MIITGMANDNSVYNEAYYTGGEEYYSDELTLLCADGAGCSTPELVFVAAPVEWIGESVASDADYAPELYEYHPLD